MTNAPAGPRPNATKPTDDLIGVDNNDTDGLVEKDCNAFASECTGFLWSANAYDDQV